MIILGAATLALRTGSDGYYANGPGVWLMHDHTPEASSNKGISPGGDHTMIVYEGFLGADGLRGLLSRKRRPFSRSLKSQ